MLRTILAQFTAESVRTNTMKILIQIQTRSAILASNVCTIIQT